jgi:type II secretory pathway component GspD/PulD (secretin)
LLYYRRPLTEKAKLDPKPAPPQAEKETASLELRVYSLRHASATDMAQIIDDVLRINKYVMRIAPDPRSNQLIVNATKEAHLDVETLLRQLDVPADAERAAPSIGGPPPGGGKKRIPN